MADPPPYPDTGDDTGAGPDRVSTPSRRRWVYVAWGIGILVVLLFVALHLAGVMGPGGH